jgi:hypothetical protein
MTSEWVALMTWMDDASGMFYEAGGVYPDWPHCQFTTDARKLEPGEHVARCPRCSQKFATVEEGSAESCRNLHFDGDEDCPSICVNMPPRRLRLVDVHRKG